ncbi:MAG TPA: alpha/beta hydrolase [Pseudonocardiaceae bacterium]|nr:alpha/beta hydrolase [Pseudonocardiaceae bacterium]
MAEITARGTRFHVQELIAREGARRLAHPVVFIHGLGMDNLSSFYYTLANPVAYHGAAVILYDLRGHGLSERPRTGYRVSDSAADLAALLATLGIGGPVHLVGNSYGGTVALRFAVTYPRRVASMVLIEAHVPIPGWAQQMATTITNIGADLTEGELGAWMARSRKHANLAALGKDLIKHTTFVADLLATEPVLEQDLRAFTQPVRAVYGERSDVIHHAHVLDSLLPRCELTILPDVDHSVLTKATRALRAIVLEWFAADALTARAATW